jgi:hypothetical protein
MEELRILDEQFALAVKRATDKGLAAQAAKMRGDQLTAHRLFRESSQALAEAQELEEDVHAQMSLMLGDVDMDTSLSKPLAKVLPFRPRAANNESIEEVGAARIFDVFNSPAFEG